MIITGLDLSLTGSGVATIVLNTAPDLAPRIGYSREPTIGLREFGSKPTLPDLDSRSIRIRSVAAPVVRACVGSDIVAVEDMFTGRGTGAELDRAGLFWIVVNSLCARGVPVVAVTNNHLKMWAVGKGGGKGTDKDHILAATVKRFPDVDVTSNNTADALNLAAMTAHFYGHPIVPMPATNLRALAGPNWPNLKTNREEAHG